MENTFEEKMNKEIIRSKKNFNMQLQGAYTLTEPEIRGIFETNHEVNVQRDESGNLIPGSGRLITNEEKKQIFDFIIENNYPITRNVYNIVLNAYINDEIELNLNKVPKL